MSATVPGRTENSSLMAYYLSTLAHSRELCGNDTRAPDQPSSQPWRRLRRRGGRWQHDWRWNPARAGGRRHTFAGSGPLPRRMGDWRPVRDARRERPRGAWHHAATLRWAVRLRSSRAWSVRGLPRRVERLALEQWLRGRHRARPRGSAGHRRSAARVADGHRCHRRRRALDNDSLARSPRERSRTTSDESTQGTRPARSRRSLPDRAWYWISRFGNGSERGASHLADRARALRGIRHGLAGHHLRVRWVDRRALLLRGSARRNTTSPVRCFSASSP